MIQLATDPNASRSTNWRPAAAEAKDNTSARRPRSAHAWPFISRHAERTETSQDTKRTPTSGSGS